jgi:tight adherence protein B
MPDPAGTEFGIASDEVTFGLDVPTAIFNLSKRVGAPDLLYLRTSISIQSQAGGNLGEILSRLARMIRERFKLARKVKSLTAEGRMSGIVLTVMPIVVFFIIKWLSPSYYGEVWQEPGFRKAMGVAIFLLLLGNYIIRRMVNFKY